MRNLLLRHLCSGSWATITVVHVLVGIDWVFFCLLCNLYAQILQLSLSAHITPLLRFEQFELSCELHSVTLFFVD